MTTCSKQAIAIERRTAMEAAKFMIVCDQRACDSLKPELDRIGIAQPKTSDVRGLGGEVVELIIAGTVAAKAIAALLDVIAATIKAGNAIRTLKINDNEITNPNEPAVEKLKQELGS
jgi:hypothetical protein